jgi:polysaccharide deacetylase family protein (PEP-CTERM system associated)
MRRPADAVDTRILNAMTIDVEDYFHVSVFDGVVPRSEWAGMESRVARNTDRLLGLFHDGGIKATFFTLGWVAERCPDLVRRIAAAGHEVASHGYAHRLIYDQTPAAFREDVRSSKALLEDIAGVCVVGYRAPSYSITPRSLWALDILIDEGYGYDASIFPIHHDRYGIPLAPRFPFVLERGGRSLVEVPGSTVRVGSMNLPVGGGGYFRLLPYTWTRWGFARVNDEGHAGIFYLHPWEIDPDQPRLRTSLLGRVRHYRNLSRTEARLAQLLRDFRFGRVRDVVASEQTDHASNRSALALPYVW